MEGMLESNLLSCLHLLTSILFFHPSILKPPPTSRCIPQLLQQNNKKNKTKKNIPAAPPGSTVGVSLPVPGAGSEPSVHRSALLLSRLSLSGFPWRGWKIRERINHRHTFFLLPSLLSHLYVKCYRCAFADLDPRTSDQRHIPELCVRRPFALRMANY